MDKTGINVTLKSLRLFVDYSANLRRSSLTEVLVKLARRQEKMVEIQTIRSWSITAREPEHDAHVMSMRAGLHHGCE